MIFVWSEIALLAPAFSKAGSAAAGADIGGAVFFSRGRAGGATGAEKEGGVSVEVFMTRSFLFGNGGVLVS